MAPERSHQGPLRTASWLPVRHASAQIERVDEVYAAITNAGFTGKKAPWDAFWGQRYACVLDPDGNQVDLFA